MATSVRLIVVPGVTPAKWVRVWHERLPDVPLHVEPVAAADAHSEVAAPREGTVAAGLVRLPVDPEVLHAIPLYEERTVVVVPVDHAVTAAEEIGLDDLADDVVLHPLDDVLVWDGALPGRPALDRPVTTADAVALVAAGVGVLLVPQSIARFHHRKDVTYRPVADAPTSRVGLAWPLADDAPDLVEELIGIVRGRTAHSSRGRGTTAAEPAAPEAGGGRRGAPGTGQARAGAKGGAGGKRRPAGARPARPARKGPRRTGR